MLQGSTCQASATARLNAGGVLAILLPRCSGVGCDPWVLGGRPAAAGGDGGGIRH